jgi:hypothetical protein
MTPPGAALAVTQMRRNGELAHAAFFHAGDALVPAADDLTGAQLEAERVVAVLARVELASVGEPAGVMHADLVTRCRFMAGARRGVLDDEAAFGSA